MARDGLSIIAARIWTIFFNKKRILAKPCFSFICFTIVYKSPHPSVSRAVVLVNIHTYFTALQLEPEFEKESTISPFSELPLAVYCVGCGVGHRF